MTYAINNQSAYGCIYRWLVFLCAVKNTSARGAFSRSTACVTLDAMHSAVCAISTCWGAISLLYRREQDPQSPARLIRFKYSQEPMFSVPLVLFKHPWQACVTPSAHLCVWFPPPRSTIMKITSQQSSIKITANPSLYPLPVKKLLSQKPRRTQQISASSTSCVSYKITTLIYRATVGRLLKLPTGATEQ